MKKVINVNNIANFEFWVNMFRLRSITWQKQRLKILKQGKSVFETYDENLDKIKALEFILKG
jgi:hypothetical protein